MDFLKMCFIRGSQRDSGGSPEPRSAFPRGPVLGDSHWIRGETDEIARPREVGVRPPTPVRGTICDAHRVNRPPPLWSSETKNDPLGYQK